MMNLQLTNELCLAAASGNVAEIRRAIEAGADPNQSSNYGWTPLRYASERGKSNAIRALLKLGADIHRGERLPNDSTYLHHAVQSGNAESVRLLLAAGSDPEARDKAGETPLHYAARCEVYAGAAIDTGIPRIVARLIAAGANPCAVDDYGVTPLHWAAENANVELVRLLLRHGSDPNAANVHGFTPLHFSAHSRAKHRTTSATAQTLLEAGASADSPARGLGSGATALILAASHAAVAVVAVLLAAGANPNFVDNVGRSPLTEAITNAENFAALLAAGADLSPLLKATGKPLLLTAAERGNAPAVQALLAANADPNKAYRGKYPLHAAVAKANADAVAALLAAGANHLLPGKDGVTALDLARKRRRKAILPLLEAAETARQAKGQPA
ncbi:MAG: ankyrin repeat domain-containing protein [Armatimonadetes bacterium]|nr:ankyrin repeat domain-containing protein [Armatimonadota bacterium]